MAKFVYRMQNILNIKYKLEEQAKQEYQEIVAKLNEAKDVLKVYESKKIDYMNEYRRLTSNVLDILMIESCKESIVYIDEKIRLQKNKITIIESDLERGRIKLTEVMKERKTHEKLKENQFDEFVNDLNSQEKKEIDELVSYMYNGDKDKE